MADGNYILGTSSDDQLKAEPGFNDMIGGLGNDTIDATDGVNIIHYGAGDGVDSVSFALPRTYQYADYLTAAKDALAELSNFTGTDYSNGYFATADQGLINTLPPEISSVLSLMQQNGTVVLGAAQAAFSQLIDWINAPIGNIVQFGPGIRLSDLTVQVGGSVNFGSQGIPTQFAVALNNQAGMVFSLAGTQVTGDTSAPPTIDMRFQFADGTTAMLADLLTHPGQGVIGAQTGGDGDDFLHGSLGDDTLLGNAGDDKLDGRAGSDQLFGGAGHDVISGGSGWDIIYGEEGDDVMAAGKDGGFMSGGAGDDVYCFNRGDGQVIISNADSDSGSVDTLSFGKDVAASDLIASVDASGHLTLAIAGTADAITIDWFDAPRDDNDMPLPLVAKADGMIERVQFFDADGTAHVYDLISLVNAALPDPSAAANSGASAQLVAPSSTKRSLSEVGQPYARSYALTGNLFPGENQAPTTVGMADQTAKQDQHFSYVVPLVDPEGASLALSVTTPDGSALPSWLHFDADTGELSGTPSNSDVGTVALIVTAVDSGGLSASASFNLQVQNVNDSPVLANPIPNQSATQGIAFSYTVPTDTFADVDQGDTLSYSARLADGSALPDWLKFDPAKSTFSGMPANADVTTLSVQVTATDTSGASALSVFGLDIVNVNDAPTLANPIPNQSATQGVAFSYTVPTDTFADIDQGDTLSYSARLADGSALPNWLKFDPAARTLSGTPSGATGDGALSAGTTALAGASGSAGPWSIDIVATDSSGASASDEFILSVNAAPVTPPPVDPGPVDPPPPPAPPPVVVPPVDPSWHTIRGTRHNDRLFGTSGNDMIMGGRGNDRLWGRDGDDVLLGDSGNDRLDGGSGNDYLQGGRGKDQLNGGRGVDVLQGGSGDDRLTDTSGNNVFDGGDGNDTLTDGNRDSMLVGGRGKDHLYLGGGYDIIAFNRGDGRDVVSTGKGGNATLSLGGGIRYEDLSLRRSGNDLILDTGNGNDKITFEKWYAGKKYQAVSKLQLVSEAALAGNSGDKIEFYDLTGLVRAYDAARKQHPGISKWVLTDAQTQFHLGGSDSAALGGDLAYQYGVNGTLAGIAINAAQGTASSSQFGKQSQTLDSQSHLKDELVKLS